MANKTVVDASKRRYFPDILELFRYKDLLIILAYRDIRVRYAQTVLGLAWTLLEPLATLLISVLIFQKAIQVDTGDIPYVLFAFAGISAWSYFAYILKESGRSIIDASQMIKKIFFPRLAIPVSKAVVGMVDYVVTLLLLTILMISYSYVPGPNWFMLPVFILATMITALTVGIWVGALTIRYRDLQHVVPFFVQFGFFATPIAYPKELVLERIPEWASFVYYLNPMAGIVDGIRWSLFDTAPPDAHSYISYAVILILLITGLFYFKKIERVMADLV